MTEQIKRQIAYHVKVSEILTGEYVEEEGWNPNYVKTFRGEVSRVNIIGVVIAVTDDSVTIDDGSGKIDVRSFENKEKFGEFDLGDVVILIGRPRAWNEQKYIAMEIMRTINPVWAKVRKEELKNVSEVKQEVKREEKEEVQEMKVQASENLIDKVVEVIKRLDSGDGVDTEKVISECDADKTEEIIDNLIKEGEIFEIRKGKLKVL